MVGTSPAPADHLPSGQEANEVLMRFLITLAIWAIAATCAAQPATVLVTGSNRGLGLEFVKQYAEQGWRVIATARNPGSAEELQALARANQNVTVERLDLLDYAGIEALAQDYRGTSIDVLLNNAGVMVCPYSTNADGFENQLVSNHLGHFLLSVLLTPALIRGAPARVIELSSGAHGMSDFDFDDPNFERREYNPWIAYGQSKTANALFALEYDRRLRARGVSAFSVHPGVIMTELGRHMTEETMQQMQDHVRAQAGASGTPLPDEPPEMTFKSVEAGAATQCWAATASELDDQGGKYLADCQVAVVGGDIGENGVAPYAQDAKAAARLWAMSEEWVGQKLEA